MGDMAGMGMGDAAGMGMGDMSGMMGGAAPAGSDLMGMPSPEGSAPQDYSAGTSNWQKFKDFAGSEGMKELAKMAPDETGGSGGKGDQPASGGLRPTTLGEWNLKNSIDKLAGLAGVMPRRTISTNRGVTV